MLVWIEVLKNMACFSKNIKLHLKTTLQFHVLKANIPFHTTWGNVNPLFISMHSGISFYPLVFRGGPEYTTIAWGVCIAR